MEVIVASSSVDSAIGSWDLRSGSEQLRYKSSASPPHGLLAVARRFLASSQHRDSPKSASSQILFWSWDKPQFEVRSFPAEPIGPLVSNSEGAYIIGGGSSGSIYLWEVWSLSEGRLLRNIVFPSIIDAIAMDPGEHAFYAGGRDGRIYIAALNAECNPDSRYGLYIIGALSDHSKAVTCLAFSMDGVTLVSGSEDGMVRVWDTKSQHVTRVLKHGKGPVNNVLIVRQPARATPQGLVISQVPIPKKRLNLSLPSPLEKYMDSDGEVGSRAIAVLQLSCHDPQDSLYRSSYMMESQIKDLQLRGSSGAVEMELERLRQECKISARMVHQWRKLYHDLQNICVSELLGEAQLGNN